MRITGSTLESWASFHLCKFWEPSRNKTLAGPRIRACARPATSFCPPGCNKRCDDLEARDETQTNRKPLKEIVNIELIEY